jgi:hypothetical protein
MGPLPTPRTSESGRGSELSVIAESVAQRRAGHPGSLCCTLLEVGKGAPTGHPGVSSRGGLNA